MTKRYYPFEDVPLLASTHHTKGEGVLECDGCEQSTTFKEFEDITDKVYAHRNCFKRTPGVTLMSEIDPQK